MPPAAAAVPRHSGRQRRDTPALSLCRSGGLDCAGRIRNCGGIRGDASGEQQSDDVRKTARCAATDLKAGLSRLCSTVMASTSGPLSATNLASFSAISLDSASTGGETLSSLSVLGLNSHSYYCTVFNQPSHTTSLEPIEDKKRSKEGQEGGGGEWRTDSLQ